MRRHPQAVRGPLRPVEVATAGVMGAITVATAVLGWILPHASAVQAAGAVPMGLLAQRHRPRAVLAAVVAGCVVSFLVAGTGPAYSVVACAVVGGLVGEVKRRERGVAVLVAATVALAPLLAAASDGLLYVFSASRALTLDQVRNAVHGITGTMGRVQGLGGAARHLDRWTATALAEWWATVAVLVVVGLAVSVSVGWVLVGAVLDRLSWMAPDDRLDAPDDPRPVAPLPVRARDVRVRYPGATADALHGASLVIDRPELVALVGENGSGKSTLARVLTGRPPDGGTVERAGSPGLGRPGGTALVGQRPESQVLGVRVADDVVWGLPAGVAVDVEALLEAVGLAGMGTRETAGLSGGELQRLALAAALARRPRLLLSDESTAMIDQAGRRQLMALLGRLPAERAMAVVHVTHRADEAGAAERVVRLAGGRIAAGGHAEYLGAAQEALATLAAPRAGSRRRRPVLAAQSVSHTYAAGTPWAQPALAHVELTVGEGDGLLIVGGNGSGKSTLAWALSGLLRTSEGRCLLDGRPVDEQVGAVALAFQHARLQLQRPTVGADIRAASGIGPEAVAAALGQVGLGADVAARRVDQLSGGEMRRAALAGLLARRPRVLILDEPLAGLDPPSRRALLELLVRLRSEGLTLVVISHDLEGIGAVCDRAVRLAGGRLSAEDPSPDAPEAAAGAVAGP